LNGNFFFRFIIDDFLSDLIQSEQYKKLNDLIILGFNELIDIIQTRFGNADEMNEKNMQSQAEQIFSILPQTKVLKSICNIVNHIGYTTSI
jgi:hypothetical protein